MLFIAGCGAKLVALKKGFVVDKETFIIKAFLNAANGDDGAVLGKWCYSKDLFFEGVHFKREWLSYEQIARKAMLVNISDAIVMNAVPKYALLGLALPKDITKAQIQALQQGFLQTAREFGIIIIGGDTISSDKISISITLISKVRKKAIFRKGLKKGDLLAFTGILGESLKGLKALQNGEKLHTKHRFFEPNLRGEFFYKIAPKVRCAMDISDGLGQDLAKMLALNKFSVKWLVNLSDEELQSGEEYEILFAFAPKNAKFINKMAQKFGVRLTIFGEVVNGKYEFNGTKWHF